VTDSGNVQRRAVALSKSASGEGRHLKLVRGGGAARNGKTVYLGLLCVVWLAIVWLLFVSFVDTSQSDRTNAPAGKMQPASRPPGGR